VKSDENYNNLEHQGEGEKMPNLGGINFHRTISRGEI